MVRKHVDKSPKHFHELWQKEFRMGPVIFEYPLDLIAQNRKKWQNSEKQLPLKNDWLWHY